jgi:type IV pilus assembly protein PilW
VLYGSSSFSVTDRAFTSSTNTSKTLKPRAGMRRGDLAIVAGNDTGTAGSAQCQLVEITDDSNIDGLTILHADASYTPADGSSPRPARFNGNGAPPLFSTGMAYNLGPAPRLNVWKITGHRVLSRTDQLMAPGTAMDAGEDVIDLQAQYGIDANNNLRIEDSEWTNTQPTDWRRVLAVRFAVLVRSQQYEKTAVTTTAPTWGAGTAFVMTNVDGTPDSFDASSSSPNNWRRYRYRVYQNIVPLRNVLWGVAP